MVLSRRPSRMLERAVELVQSSFHFFRVFIGCVDHINHLLFSPSVSFFIKWW